MSCPNLEVQGVSDRSTKWLYCSPKAFPEPLSTVEAPEYDRTDPGYPGRPSGTVLFRIETTRA